MCVCEAPALRGVRLSGCHAAIPGPDLKLKDVTASAMIAKRVALEARIFSAGRGKKYRFHRTRRIAGRGGGCGCGNEGRGRSG